MNGSFYAVAAAGVVAAFIGGTAGYLYWGGGESVDPLAQCREGQAAGGDIGGPFTLLNKDGATVSDKDILKKPALVYFGYTFCPDVCPFDMARNAEALDILEEQGQDVELVFISVDPERDTPEVVGEYAEAMHPKAIGLTGSMEQITDAARAYKVYFKRQNGDPDYYMVDHSAFTYLMLPGKGFADFYKRDASADQIANSVGCMLEASAAS